MIRAYVLYDARKLETLSAFLEAYPELALETVQDVFDQRIKPHLLSELRHTPGPAKHPFAFATEKSRRWYFHAVRSGLIPTDGERYLRTGKTMQAWEVGVTISDDAVALSAKNPKRHIKWLTGNRQVPGHRVTGWPPHDETLIYWAGVAKEETGQALRSLIGSLD